MSWIERHKELNRLSREASVLDVLEGINEQESIPEWQQRNQSNFDFLTAAFREGGPKIQAAEVRGLIRSNDTYSLALTAQPKGSGPLKSDVPIDLERTTNDTTTKVHVESNGTVELTTKGEGYQRRLRQHEDGDERIVEVQMKEPAYENTFTVIFDSYIPTRVKEVRRGGMGYDIPSGQEEIGLRVGSDMNMERFIVPHFALPQQTQQRRRI